MALMETLVDSFNEGAGAAWVKTASDDPTQVLPQYDAIYVNHSAAAQYNRFDSATAYDLTGSAAYVQIRDFGHQTLVSHEVYLWLESGADAVLMFASANSLIIAKRVAGVSSTLTSLALDQTQHGWWRIRESGGTTFWDTAPDGVTWTNRWSVANPIVLTSLTARLICGCWQTEAQSSYAIFDNFNTADPSPSAYRPTQIANGHVGPMAQRRALRGHVRFSPQSFPDPGVDYAQAATDPVGSTDAVAATTDFARSATDPVGELDSTAVTQDWVRSQTDLLGTTDSATGAQGFDRSATDTAGVTDGIAVAVSTGATDPVGLVDTAASDVGRSPSDLEGVGDSSTVQQDWVRTPADLLGVADSLGLAATRDATDLVGLGDVGSAVQDWARTGTDQIAAADSSALAQDWARSQADLVGVTDTTAAVTDFVRASTDTVNAADALSTVANYQRAAADPCDLTDDATFVLTAPGEANADELVDVADTAVLALSTSRSASEPVGVGDSASTQSTRATVDDLAVTDTTGFVANYIRSLTDPVGVADSATFTITIGATDTTAVSDTTRLDRDTPLVDTADLTDAAVFSLAYTQALTDPVGVADSATFQLGDNIRVAVEPIGVTDSLLVDIFTAPGPDNTWVLRAETVTTALTVESNTVTLSETVTATARPESTTHTVQAETNLMEV